jgi:hypothetical protein
MAPKGHRRRRGGATLSTPNRGGAPRSHSRDGGTSTPGHGINGSARSPPRSPTIPPRVTRDSDIDPDLVPSASSVKRKQNREALERGERVSRSKRSKGTESEAGDEIVLSSFEEYARKLDRAIRWNHFLHHHNLGIPEVIAATTENKVVEDTDLYNRLRTKAMDNNRTFKNKTILLMKVDSHYTTRFLNNL